MVFLYETDSSRVRMKPVKTGIQDRQFIEVEAEGLDTTVWVVSAPFLAISKKLNDGMTVRTTASLAADAVADK